MSAFETQREQGCAQRIDIFKNTLIVLAAALIYLLAGEAILALLTDKQPVVVAAADYRLWAVAVPQAPASHLSPLRSSRTLTGSSGSRDRDYLRFFFLVRRWLTLSATMMSDAMPLAARRSKMNATMGKTAVRRNTSESSAVK